MVVSSASLVKWQFESVVWQMFVLIKRVGVSQMMDSALVTESSLLPFRISYYLYHY